MRLILLTFIAALWSSLAQADTCDDIRLLIPADLAGFAEARCEGPIPPQVRAELTFTVPPDDVEALAARLVTKYGMTPMVWLCCGYEPNAGRTGAVDIPDGLIAAGPAGSFTALSVSLFADGFKGDDTSTPMPLGALPARLLFRLMDI